MSEKDLEKELYNNSGGPDDAGDMADTERLDNSGSAPEPDVQDTERLDQPAAEEQSAESTGTEESAESVEAEESTESLESAESESPKTRSVKYEQNDNWKFDASAPAAESQVLEGAGGAEFEFESTARSKNKSADADTAQSGVDTVIKPQEIVIKKERLSVILSVLLGLVIIAVLVLLGIRYYTVPNSSEKMNPGNIAMTVGDIEVSVGMYNYYYDSIVYEYTYYANYGYYDLDSTADFSTQYTTDSDGNEISWLELFEQTTKERIKLNTMYYELGLNAGITLTEEQEEEIESQLELVTESAEEEGMSVADYVEYTFGEYCGLETLRKYMEQYYIASTYYYQYSITGMPDDDEVSEYFSEHEDEYKSCSFAVLEMEYDTTDEDTMQDSMDAAEAYAALITDVESMQALIPEVCADIIDSFVSAGYFDSEDDAVAALSESIEATQVRADVESTFGDEVAEWLFDDDENPEGSTYCYASEDAGVIYIILKTSDSFLDEDSELYSVRHILITPESDDEDDDDDSDDEYTEEEWEAAYEKALEILEEYQSGDQTELAFALLAEEYSDDTESTSSGSSGLYGGGYLGISSGTMVDEFEDWSMDSERSYGDVEIIQTDYGYHIMFFISKTTEYLYDAQQDCFTEKTLELFDATELKNGMGFRNVNSATPDSDYVAVVSTYSYY